MTSLGIYSNKAKNPRCYPNAHKLGVTIYKDMLQEEKKNLEKERGNLTK